MSWDHAGIGLVVYLLVFFVVWRRVTISELNGFARDRIRWWEESNQRLAKWCPDLLPDPPPDPLVGSSERASAKSFGLLVGLLWPFFIPFVVVIRAYDAVGRGWSSPVERDFRQQRRDAAELEQLRALATEHGLPLPKGGGIEDGEAAR